MSAILTENNEDVSEWSEKRGARRGEASKSDDVAFVTHWTTAHTQASYR
jgi:hypothetical protein